MICVAETLEGKGRGWQAPPRKFASVTMLPGDLFVRNWRATSLFMVILRPSFHRKILGWAMLVLGVLGLVLPFLQGFLFLAFGVFVLRDQHIWAARMRHFAKRLRLRG